MRKFWLAALLVVIALPVLTQASVVNFGGTALCGDTCAGVQVPDGYGDPNFTYGGAWYAYGNVPYDSSYANTYGAPSGAFAYNAFGDSPVTISSSVPFTFNGVYASTWAEFDAFQSFSSTTLEIQGFSGATLEGTVVANLSSTSFDFISANFGHTVTSLVFTNDCGTCSGRWFLIDGITYNQSSTTPEPGTMVMFGSGLLVAAGAIRRRFSLA